MVSFVHQREITTADALRRLPHEAVESPLVYTKCRDIHSVGVILLQMLMGSDVMQRFPDVHTALRNCTKPIYLGMFSVRLTVSANSDHLTSSTTTSCRHAHPEQETPGFTWQPAR